MGGVIALSLCLGLMLLLMVVSGVQIVFCFVGCVLLILGW